MFTSEVKKKLASVSRLLTESEKLNEAQCIFLRYDIEYDTGMVASQITGNNKMAIEDMKKLMGELEAGGLYT